MANDDDKPAPASDPFAHLIPRADRRTPEEKQAAERKERARRRGKGAKDWWKAPAGE